MTVVEREAALGVLLAAAATARGGSGRLVLVAGEAGVGKSTLVDALEQELPTARWLLGACDGQFTPRPLGPLVDIAAHVGGTLARRCTAEASRADQLSALLDVLDGPGLTVLVIEDAHWADEATLDLLRFLGRRVRDLPCLLVVTYRDDEVVDDLWRQALGELARQRATVRLDVHPLSLDAVRSLAAPCGLDPAVVHDLTGGNPFFVTELLAAGSTDLSRSARDAVLAKAARLGPGARATLDVAALMGGRMEPALLAKAGVDGIDVDELVGAGLLVDDGGGGVRFRHELGRVAVDAELTPFRRIEVHRLVLDALEAVGCDDDARLAFHADGAGNAAATREFALRAAARAAELGAHREAVAQYQRALRHADATDERRRAELHDAVATELQFLDRWEDAAEERALALALWRTLDEPRRVGDDLRRLSNVMWRLCRGDETVRLAEEAVAVLEPLGPTSELGWAYLCRSVDARRPEAFAADVDRARTLAAELEWSDFTGSVLVLEAEAAHRAGDDWEPPLREALRVARERGLDALAGSAYSTLYEFQVSSFRLADGDRDYLQGVAFCDDAELPVYGSCLRGRRALALVEEGRWDEALAVADLVLSSTASPVNLLTSRVATALVRMRRGAPAGEVDAVLVPALESATTLGEAPWIVMTQLACAEQHWLLGDDDTARAHVAVARRALGPLFPHEGREVESWEHRLAVSHSHSPVTAAVWDERRCRYRAALALVDRGEEQDLREALGRLEALGAAAAGEVVRRRLRRMGVRAVASGSAAATRRHPLGLTVRQQEVLELLAAGLTNDEIGARLFISAKTVDHHVSAVLAKLGVSNRRQAAALAADRGLLTP